MAKIRYTLWIEEEDLKAIQNMYDPDFPTYGMMKNKSKFIQESIKEKLYPTNPYRVRLFEVIMGGRGGENIIHEIGSQKE